MALEEGTMLHFLKLVTLTILASLAMPCRVSAQVVDPLDLYNVVWDTPSADSSGSMPIGNGDVGANVWVEPNGDLRFYISKTDSWDENARLVKVGRVRIHLDPNPFLAGNPFRQTLRLRQSEIQVCAGKRHSEVILRVWVDANAPVIRVEAAGRQSFTISASIDLWRTSLRQIANSSTEIRSAFGQENGPNPVYVYPDTIVPALGNQVAWYHRNTSSIWTQTLTHQGLSSWLTKDTDPLINRTYGGLMNGQGFTAVSNNTIQSAEPRKTHSLAVYVHTAQTGSADEWLSQIRATAAQVSAQDIDVVRNLHYMKWNAFWDRSWIRVPKPCQAPISSASEINVNNLPLRIGADNSTSANNKFLGKIDRVRIFNRALTPTEISAHALGQETIPADDPAKVADWTFDNQSGSTFPNTLAQNLPASIVGTVNVVTGKEGKCVELTGSGYLQVPDDPLLDLTKACTVETWVAPQSLPSGGARIIDKIAPGGTNGYLFDTYPYNSLRMIITPGTLSYGANLPVGQWSHVAAVFDKATGEQSLYVNGTRVAGGTQFPSLQPDVSQSYTLQRYITACSGQGAYPIKFNGSIFTVDSREPGKYFDADFRDWGGCYWMQNTRLPYWPLLSSGDYDLMQPYFNMYQEMIPFCKERTTTYWGHAGAMLPECIYSWGAYPNRVYGWNRTGRAVDFVEGGAVRYHYNGALELLSIMLDYYDHTRDSVFLQTQLLPMADEFISFWDLHYSRDSRNLLKVYPNQALEGYIGSSNPMPDVAGLHWVLGGLLSLPDSAIGTDRRTRWTRLKGEVLWPLPVRTVNGQTVLSPAESIVGSPNSTECPETYPVFPYRFYGVNKPNIELGRQTWHNRTNKGNKGWQYADITAAFLGLTTEAKELLSIRSASKHSGSRFPAFYGPNWDWIPDQCCGGNIMMALQTMLIQTDNEKILLFPAWPKEWDVDFKLHAPGNTTVEGVYKAGKLESLKVTPSSRLADVIQLTPQ